VGLGIKERIGVLGGTFDPIHMGHLAIARCARSFLDLDYILLIPAGQPWLRQVKPVESAYHRLAMTKLTAESEQWLLVSDIEVNRPGPTFTVDTLEQLRNIHEDRTELYLIIGEDALKDLHRWRNPERVVKLAQVIGVKRPGVASADLKKMFPAEDQQPIILEGPLLDISAMEVRERIAAGRPIGHLVPESVETYINSNSLYR
jgi:nicotinate-nucleotide adenylyltransferase